MAGKDRCRAIESDEQRIEGTANGGDDRNLAIYFVFVDPKGRALSLKIPRRILQE